MFLWAWLASGVPLVKLIRVQPVLARTGPSLNKAVCQRVQRLLLATPGRCPSSSLCLRSAKGDATDQANAPHG